MKHFGVENYKYLTQNIFSISYFDVLIFKNKRKYISLYVQIYNFSGGKSLRAFSMWFAVDEAAFYDAFVGVHDSS